MSFTFAITGKGGTGKTTISALTVVALTHIGKGPILVVDADPNKCLDVALGVKAQNTVGRIREDAKIIASQHPAIPKRQLIELKINESLIEGNNFDFIAMGRPEGAGCYCYANNLLREIIKEISASYPFIVIDNEAGLENLSRRLSPKVDVLVIVGEPTKNGIETIWRIMDLAREMEILYKKLVVIINRIFEMKDNYVKLKNHKVDDIILLPYDEQIRQWNEEGKNFFMLPKTNEVYKKLRSSIESYIC